jgi:hypothetical protein
MSKPRDAAKERYWRNLVRRQQSSGLGTRRFCAQVGVPEHRFHWWRRTLRWRDQYDDPGVHSTDTAQAISAGSKEDCSAFVPVRLPFSLSGSIEVVHPRGYVIRVPSVFDASVLQRILSMLDSSSAS